MSDDDCIHSWGEAELCETRHGNISSPVCRHCGAVKLELERVRPAGRGIWPSTALDMLREQVAAAPIATNNPPAGVRVHAVQMRIFEDI